MGLKAYKLRPEYQDDLVGGRFVSGAGQEKDLKEELEAGNGEIITDDTLLQSVLENYFGHSGPLFDIEHVNGDERIPLSTEPVVNQSVLLPPPAPHAGLVGAAGIPDAQHDDVSSEYAGLTDDELRSTVNERGLKASDNTDTQGLIAVLEADDHTRQEGASSGS